MNLDKAEVIRQAWGYFLEHYASKFMVYFSSGVPESFLPYTKKEITEAVSLFASELEAEGQNEAAETLKSSLSYLVMYTDDETALSKLRNNLNNPAYLKTALKVQKRRKVT